MIRICSLLRSVARYLQSDRAITRHYASPNDNGSHGSAFGITMEQRGISKLVSVDLQAAKNP